jgi:hypothetical protein
VQDKARRAIDDLITKSFEASPSDHST